MIFLFEPLRWWLILIKVYFFLFMWNQITWSISKCNTSFVTVTNSNIYTLLYVVFNRSLSVDLIILNFLGWGDQFQRLFVHNVIYFLSKPDEILIQEKLIFGTIFLWSSHLLVRLVQTQLSSLINNVGYSRQGDMVLPVIGSR